MAPSESASFWEAVRSWADSAGLLLPNDSEGPVRPTVPQSVCDSCPICQAAATVDQVNPQVIADFTEVARSIVLGLGSALAAAAENRSFVTGHRAETEPDGSMDTKSSSEPGDSEADRGVDAVDAAEDDLADGVDDDDS